MRYRIVKMKDDERTYYVQRRQFWFSWKTVFYSESLDDAKREIFIRIKRDKIPDVTVVYKPTKDDALLNDLTS
jgi:hypothetical protein